MKRSIVPVISGGNNLRMMRGGTKAMARARAPVAMEVPRTAPNSDGQGRRVVPSGP